MSEPLIHVLVAVAGGLGAVCRLLLDGAINERIARREAPGTLPWGIIAVNLSGSLLIGIAAGLLLIAPGDAETAPWQIALSFGFLGGYTTFSTASHQTVRLAQAGRWGAAFANGLGQLAVACAAVALGLGLVWLIVR